MLTGEAIGVKIFVLIVQHMKKFTRTVTNLFVGGFVNGL